MNRVISDAEFKAVCEKAVEEFRKRAPYDTGNLARNAICIEFPSPKECVIYVDESIAPYMPFTNEVWIAERWHGKKNPNENWWQIACEKIIQMIQELLGGELTQ